MPGVFPGFFDAGSALRPDPLQKPVWTFAAPAQAPMLDRQSAAGYTGSRIKNSGIVEECKPCSGICLNIRQCRGPI